mmetsp:Transcript_68202/g.200282  ORF Transcript_68202/g.200282 Transcript_68202/m.200282 type:complete len:327 (-) Transcript_68202:40-1020(-)
MAEEAEKIINGFKAAMWKGKVCHKMSATGPGVCKVKLDQEMTTLTVSQNEKKRDIPMETIEQIAVGLDGEDAVDFTLDELSVTIVPEEGDPVVLRFGDMEARDTFALCLGMFVDQMKGGEDEDYEEEEQEEEEEYEESEVESLPPPPPKPAPKPAKVPPAPAAIPPVPSSSGSASRPSNRDDDGDGRRSKKDSKSSKLSQSQRVMKKFIETAVKGRTLQMLATTGAFVEVVLKLDRDVTSVSIQRAGSRDGKKRNVLLKDVVEIGVGADSAHTEVVDDLLVTLLLEGETAVAFRFGDYDERDEFADCLETLVKGNRRESKVKTTHL